MSAPPFAIAHDGVAAVSSLSSKDFLLNNPSGAYTTARTCGMGRRLFEWETHVTRTAASAAAMLAEGSIAEPARQALLATLGSPEALRPRLDATVSSAVREFVDAHGDGKEMKVTVLVHWEDDVQEDGAAGSISCHIAPLPSLPTPPLRVEVRGTPRANAAAKNSAWVADRAPLESLMRASAVGDINELLLATHDGELLEGSQTNFYAIVDGAVHTAGSGILEGTVRRLLLEVCAREGIPVVLSPPKLADAAAWEGALISSTSRLMLPIDELYVPNEGAPSTANDLRAAFETGPGSLAHRLQALVTEEVDAHSTEIPL
jgi:branched-subunit amino acid aminotransferase/4-amino-4-deoxychorismate lyase